MHRIYRSVADCAVVEPATVAHIIPAQAGIQSSGPKCLDPRLRGNDRRVDWRQKPKGCRRRPTFSLTIRAKSSGPADRLSLAARLPNLQAGRGAAVAFALARSLLRLRSITFIVQSLPTFSFIFGHDFRNQLPESQSSSAMMIGTATRVAAVPAVIYGCAMHHSFQL
jgi:hypothetical protein